MKILIVADDFDSLREYHRLLAGVVESVRMAGTASSGRLVAHADKSLNGAVIALKELAETFEVITSFKRNAPAMRIAFAAEKMTPSAEDEDRFRESGVAVCHNSKELLEWATAKDIDRPV